MKDAEKDADFSPNPMHEMHAGREVQDVKERFELVFQVTVPLVDDARPRNQENCEART